MKTPGPKRPNLLFVFADQMRGMDMGCAGNPDVHTPAMDRLASEGLRLTHCYATVPVCGPNRAVLLTGTYPLRNRVVANDLALPTDLPSLGTIAKENGPRTGYIGKWHLDGPPRSKWTPPGPRRQGFDFWAAYNCTHDYFNPKYYRDTPDVIEVEGYEPQVQTDLALEFLAEQSPDQPFCLVLSWGPPHDPYSRVPAEYRELYDPDKLTLRPNTAGTDTEPLLEECRRTLADYYAAITALDDQLARLLEALERQGMAEDTIVIFTSDHGDLMWSHGWFGKEAPYEESISVPFLIRWADAIKPSTTSDVLIGTVDLLPTLCGLLEWKSEAVFDGLDLSSNLKGESGEKPDSLFIVDYVVPVRAINPDKKPTWRAVRTSTHTYAETPQHQPWMVFDNIADPFQMNNLIGSETAGEIIGHLQARLRQWMDKTGDPGASGFELMHDLDLEADYQAARDALIAMSAQKKAAQIS